MGSRRRSATVLFSSILPVFEALGQDTPVRPIGIQNIEHIVFILKENHSFDNLFGTFPGADGATSGLTSTGRVVPLIPAPDIYPHDLDHTWKASINSVDGGKMDGFDLIVGGDGTLPLGPSNYPGELLAYRQYTQAQIPNYFAYASHFVLGDHMFSSDFGSSFPNHLFSIGAQSGGAMNNPSQQGVWGCDSVGAARVNVLTAKGVISPKYPCFDFPTLADEMNTAGVSWKYYAPPPSDAGYIWSAFDAIRHIRLSTYWTNNVVNWNNFETDAQNGSLPQVSWLVTDWLHSEHPPASMCMGENSTVEILNALMQGPDWPSTAVFIVWDDFGGMYDHLVPPSFDQHGMSLRVPLLVISPYAKPGYISKTPYEFSSILKFIEERFSLPSLTARDSAANDMMDAFDFTQTPLQPLVLSAHTCPIVSAPEVLMGTSAVGRQALLPQLVTVTNTTTSVLNINSISITASDGGPSSDFSQTNNCPTGTQGVQPGHFCNIRIAFTPTAAGLRTGLLQVSDNGPGSPHTTQLQGTGGYAGLSTQALQFQPSSIGVTTQPLTATLTNLGSAPLSISSIPVYGEYAQTNDCGTGLAPSASCTISVTFTPRQAGLRPGKLAIVSSDASSPLLMNLDGSGIGILPSPVRLNYGSQAVGTLSAPQTVTLTSMDAIPVFFAKVTVPAGFSATTTCTTVRPKGTCTIQVTFAPAQPGSYAGSIVLADTDSASPQTVTVSGQALSP